MPKQTITIELDAETIRRLTALGEPREVLLCLAHSVADGTGRPARVQRDQTDTSLKAERDKADVEIDASAGPEDAPTEAQGDRHVALTVERAATDLGLTGERTHADTVLIDQREANEQMVIATLRAQELKEEADIAKERAEANASDLRSVAEFREMFLGMLGHDLRNPLAAIVMSAGLLLRRGRLDEQDAKTTSRIVRSTQRMTRMITQLLDLTRARLGGGLPIEVKPIDMREVCGNVAEEFGSIVRLEATGDLTGTWDPDRVAEALSNLAGNAIEYAKSGTPVVISATVDGDAVVIAVSNQGEPIRPEIYPYIFEPFRRGQQPDKSPTRNLGLGLYIARQIVLSHGGTLDACSADGTTTFTMRLPKSPPASG